MYPDGQGWAQGVVTCARQGALFTLAAPGFAHTAATAYLLGDPLNQRQGAGARPQRPVTESLFHGDSLVRCNRQGAWGWASSQCEGKSTEGRGQRCGQPPPPGLARLMSQPGKFGCSQNFSRNGCSGSARISPWRLPDEALGSYRKCESRTWGWSCLSPPAAFRVFSKDVGLACASG